MTLKTLVLLALTGVLQAAASNVEDSDPNRPVPAMNVRETSSDQVVATALAKNFTLPKPKQSTDSENGVYRTTSGLYEGHHGVNASWLDDVSLDAADVTPIPREAYEDNTIRGTLVSKPDGWSTGHQEAGGGTAYSKYIVSQDDFLNESILSTTDSGLEADPTNYLEPQSSSPHVTPFLSGRGSPVLNSSLLSLNTDSVLEKTYSEVVPYSSGNSNDNISTTSTLSSFSAGRGNQDVASSADEIVYELPQDSRDTEIADRRIQVSLAGDRILTSVANFSSPKMEAHPIRRNVTRLLDNLMLGYDKRLRPDFGGHPLVVKADIVIRSMGPISEKDMIYSMDCYFRQVWTDRRLSFNVSIEKVTNVSLNVKMLERIWHPDTIFINGGPSYVHTITAPNRFFRLSYDGSILYSQRLTIKASCPMHLEKFPMDTQKCPLHIASFGYTVTDVIYEWHYGNDLAAVAATDMRLSQFDLKGMPACNSTRFFKGAQHSVLTVFFDFRRHTGYFLIQVYLPCCLLVVLSWVSFWINREATSDRISLGATTMLTMTFLVLDSRNDLPKVAYSTAMDVYVVMCFFFIFASIIQFAAVHFFTKYGTTDGENHPMSISDDEDEDDDDDNDKNIFDPCDMGDESSSSMHSDGLTACLKKMWRCIMSTRSRRFTKNVRNALGLNSVSKIDKVARILFPASFCGLNIVYWMSYLKD